MVNPAQRCTKQHPCRVYGGFDQTDRGQGIRCYGFLSDDGKWAHCTREDHAGPLTQEPKSETYAHRLIRDCHCGTSHDASPPPIQPTSNGSSPTKETIYDYIDEDGKLLFQVVRRTKPSGGKSFFQRRPDGNGTWIWGREGVMPVLYGLPELVAADPAKPVFIVEGEKDRDRLVEQGLVATTNPGGAGMWLPEFGRWLQDRHVVIIPDNDKVGRDHATQVAQRLQEFARSIRVLELPDLPDKGDVSNWLNQGHTGDELVDLARNTKQWEAPEAASNDQMHVDVHQLRFRSAAEIARETPAIVPWIAEPWVAAGSITELDGKIKAGGKTTWLLALSRKVLDGEPFMGLPTTKSPVVFLTEQPMSSFREALRRADLLDREDFKVLQYQDTLQTT